MTYRGGMRGLSVSVSLVLLASLGCSRVPNAGIPIDVGPNPCMTQPEGMFCYGTTLAICDGAGNETARTDCAASGQVCATGLGCRTCMPHHVTCDGETVQLCNDEGTALTTGPTCNPDVGEHCAQGGCVNLCAEAVTDHSYIGCDYYPTVLPNSELNPTFSYAIAIANPQLVSAEVTILHGTSVLEQLVVPAGSLSVSELPWVDALRGDMTPASVLAPDGAYHVISDVPVTITQFNPLRYQSDPSCTSSRPEDGCFSYTNGASLLLPAHVLTGSYLVVARPTHVLEGSDPTMTTPTHSAAPGFVAIVNAEDHTIDVSVRSSAYTLASLDGTIPALSPGEEHTFILNAGDVVLLESADPGTPCPGETDSDMNGSTLLTYCNPGDDWDLTGTEIKTDQHVAVFSGHDCTFVPYNRWACDHLEQQLFPVESLGDELFVPVTHPLRAGEPNLLRVVAAANVHVTFDPPLDDGTMELDLMRGEFTEHEIREDVWVRANGPILGALFLVGQNYLGFDTIGRQPLAVGDPGMVLLVPTAQYRSTYEILAPDTYSQSYIGVAIPSGGQVFLDDAPITGMLSASGSTTMSTGQLRIPTGPHAVRGDRGFGLYVYGFGSYTSYIVPGGMDFVPITPPF